MQQSVIHKPKGFSLIELAVVMFIVMLLLGGLLVPLSSQIDQQRTRETNKTLAELKDALMGYVIANGRFPCPATLASNGQEAPAGGGACTSSYSGYVPAVTLGVTPVNPQGLLVDGWNNPIRYAVSNALTNALTTNSGIKNAGITSFTSASMIDICASTTGITVSSCGTATTLANNVPAIIFSTGKNGSVAAAVGTDEYANLNGDLVFVSHDYAPPSSATGEFDDLVSWISSGILVNRMVTAGQLP